MNRTWKPTLEARWSFLTKLFLVVFPVLLTCSIAYASWTTAELLTLRHDTLRIQDKDTIVQEGRLFTKEEFSHIQRELNQIQADLRHIRFQQVVIQNLLRGDGADPYQ